MASQPEANEEEDDYLSMTISEPEQSKYETSFKRRARQKKEAEARSHTKSKVEQAAEEAKAREVALATKISGSSKGFKMLSRLGYKPGTALGPESGKNTVGTAIDPIYIEVKSDKAGVGLDSEKKRKIREHAADGAKRAKMDETTFRERISKEKGDERYEHLWRASMKTLESFENSLDSRQQRSLTTNVSSLQETGSKSTRDQPNKNELKTSSHQATATTNGLGEINILYRSLIKERLSKDSERSMGSGVASFPYRESSDEISGDDERFINSDVGDIEPEDDAELNDLEALEPQTRLEQVVEYLRCKHLYCFWCKCVYEDANMNGCPGRHENDHG